MPTLDGGIPTLIRRYLLWTGVTPPPPPKKTEKQSEYLLHGGRYASCVHAGGLSCLKSFVLLSSYIFSSAQAPYAAKLKLTV